MVQCSMTLRGHNPHDSQVRMEGYRMSVIVSHVCEVLHETHKKRVLKERWNGHQHSQVPAVQLW